MDSQKEYNQALKDAEEIPVPGNIGIMQYLSPVAKKYLVEVIYSLDYKEGEPTTELEALNHCLEELAAFEAVTEDLVASYLGYDDVHRDVYKEWVEENKSGFYKQ